MNKEEKTRVLPKQIDVELVLDKLSRMNLAWKNGDVREILRFEKFDDGILIHNDSETLRLVVDRFGNWTLLHDEKDFLGGKLGFNRFRKIYSDILRAMSI